MAIVRKDEILEKAIAGDASAVPRYNMRNPDGTLIAENITLELANKIAQNGTPVNAAALNEMLAASGTTGGASTAFTLAQEGYYLFDGAPIRIRLHTASGTRATLNVNGTGAKLLVNATGNPAPSGLPEGVWITATYSLLYDAYVVTGIDTPKWITEIVSATKAVQLVLPDGYDIIRLSATFYTDDTYAGVDFATDVKFTGSLVGADSGSATQDYAGRVYGTVSNENYIATGTTGRRSFVDMMIYRNEGTTVQGTSGGGRVVAFSNYSETMLRTITVTPDNQRYNITNGVIILEGIA